MTDAPPTTGRRWLPIAVVLLLLTALGVGGYLVWDQFLRGDDVAPIGFSSPSPQTSVGPSGTVGPSTGSGSSPASPASVAPASSGVDPAVLAGHWTVGAGSVAGYRVRERLGPVAADTDAVGRTEEVSGSATLAAADDSVRVTDGSFEVDVSTLASDDGRRDARIRSIGLESAVFPTAAFVLTSPVDVPAEALTGATAQVTLSGDLTIHGVAKAVSIPAEARSSDGAIEVIGSLTFPFSDFGMTPPSIGGFVTVADDATLEFRIALVRG